MNQQKINKIIKDYESGLSMAKTGEKNGVSSWVSDTDEARVLYPSEVCKKFPRVYRRFASRFI